MTLDKRPFEGKGKNGKIVSKPLDGEWWKTPFNKCVSRYLNTKKKIEEGADTEKRYIKDTSTRQMTMYQIESIEWLRKNYKFDGLNKIFRIPNKVAVSSIITLGTARIDHELGKRIMGIDRMNTQLSNSNDKKVRREVLTEKCRLFDSNGERVGISLLDWTYEDLSKYSDALRAQVTSMYAIAYDFGLEAIDPSDILEDYFYPTNDRIEEFRNYIIELNRLRFKQIKSHQKTFCQDSDLEIKELKAYAEKKT